MTKEDFKKIYDDKKTLINELLAINNQLDTLRTNINILIYNIFTNDKMRAVPKFDYDKAKTLSIDLGKLLNGTIQEYDLNKFQNNNYSSAEESLTEKGEQK